LILKDAKDLDQLINHLINKEDSEGVALLGHSTGCQVIFYSIKILNHTLLPLPFLLWMLSVKVI
jgi:surfactin synthase thioesterase subunit